MIAINVQLSPAQANPHKMPLNFNGTDLATKTIEWKLWLCIFDKLVYSIHPRISFGISHSYRTDN